MSDEFKFMTVVSFYNGHATKSVTFFEPLDASEAHEEAMKLFWKSPDVDKSRRHCYSVFRISGMKTSLEMIDF